MSNVLVIRLSAMGDVAMTVPVVASVLQQHPDLHITLISNPRFEAMFGNLERFTFVGVDTKVKYHGLAGIFRCFATCAKPIGLMRWPTFTMCCAVWYCVRSSACQVSR